MDELIKSVPSWAGTLPQWFLFASVLIAVIKVWPTIRQQDIDERSDIRTKYRSRINELEEDIKECRRLCDEQEQRLLDKIDRMQDDLHGLREQRAAEQIALIRAILQTVDSPELKKQLQLLESVQITLQRETHDVQRS